MVWEGPYLFSCTGNASWKNVQRGYEGGGEEQSVYARFWLGESLCIPRLPTGPPKEIHQRRGFQDGAAALVAVERIGTAHQWLGPRVLGPLETEVGMRIIVVRNLCTRPRRLVILFPKGTGVS